MTAPCTEAPSTIAFTILEEPVLTQVKPSQLAQAGGESVEVDGGPFPSSNLKCLFTGATAVNATQNIVDADHVQTPPSTIKGPASTQSVRRRRRPLQRFTRCEGYRGADALWCRALWRIYHRWTTFIKLKARLRLSTRKAPRHHFVILASIPFPHLWRTIGL